VSYSKKYNIQLEYFVLDPISKEIAIVAIVADSSTGFVSSWFIVAATVIMPTIISIFITRSISIVVQILHQIIYRNWKTNA
jgi:hypothetical protein